jgi:putative toxin-antitoxin system antitoxin component (TIGR02293 family)
MELAMQVLERLEQSDKQAKSPTVKSGKSFHAARSRTKVPEPSSVYGRMSRLLGAKIDSEVDLVKIVNAGLPSTALDRMVAEIDMDLRLIGSETTVRRRMQEKQLFTTDESERLVRLARVASMAEALFGNTQAAAAWLSARLDYLSDSDPISPLELAATDSGARLVESLMLRTAHGIF